MARFIGRLQGGRGEVSRLGTPASGIRATVNGWEVGVQVSAVVTDVDGHDAIYVYSTGGSNGGSPERLVAVIRRNESGAVVAETANEYDAHVERVKAAKVPERRTPQPESFEVSPGRNNRGGCY